MLKRLNIKHFVVFVTLVFLFSCEDEKKALAKISGNQLSINDSLSQIDTIEKIITPYRDRITQVMDSTLAYAPTDLTKYDGDLNTSAGNLMADITFIQANPIFKARTGKSIDFVVLNHGGIRSIIPKGKVTARNAYEIMPFENIIQVVELKGKSVRRLVQFLIDSDRAHPVSNMQIIANTNDRLEALTINGIPFDERKSYYVATTDYLIEGGKDMGFFPNIVSVTDTDYKLRNAMIDYFEKVDTLPVVVDNRFIKR